MTLRVLVTCPPMLGMIDSFRPIFDRYDVELCAPKVVQTLSERELIGLVPQYDGWIIGDDPATREVFRAGREGRLKAAVKWGIGVDNVDFDACEEFGIPVTNTPNMFGNEVADIAFGYVVALARETFEIDRGVRAGEWPKPRGISLADRTVALVGFGDIGKAAARRLLAAGMHVIAYDPAAGQDSDLNVERATWPDRIETADFIVVTCSLTPSSRHMLNASVLDRAKPACESSTSVAARWYASRTSLPRCNRGGFILQPLTYSRRNRCHRIRPCGSTPIVCSVPTTPPILLMLLNAPATSPSESSSAFSVFRHDTAKRFDHGCQWGNWPGIVHCISGCRVACYRQ
jgi:D-3-phosphoglycerate dehydrogenase / 2-oxoglutarate reductase